jgi:putative transposase
MRYDPDKHHRRSLRLKHYDYSRAGSYFITICTEERQCLFGEVVDSIMNSNDPGQMIRRWWDKLPSKFSALGLDEAVVMPNHLHGILMLRTAHAVESAPTLGDVMDWLKTMTTNEYIRGVKGLGWRGFSGRLWQRDYFEHIIRDEEELRRVREYIRSNPAQWALDAENPASVSRGKARASWEV